MSTPQNESSTSANVLLDIRGAAQFLGLTPWQVRGLIANQELPIVRVGAKFYFRRATILRWADRAEAKHKT